MQMPQTQGLAVLCRMPGVFSTTIQTLATAIQLPLHSGIYMAIPALASSGSTAPGSVCFSCPGVSFLCSLLPAPHSKTTGCTSASLAWQSQDTRNGVLSHSVLIPWWTWEWSNPKRHLCSLGVLCWDFRNQSWQLFHQSHSVRRHIFILSDRNGFPTSSFSL